MAPLALFLGCVIPNRYPGIEMATRLCLAKLDIDCTYLPGASCCPAPGVFRSFDSPTWLAVAGRNLTLGEDMQRDLLTICNGCFGSLADANRTLKENEELRKRTNVYLGEIDRQFKGTIDVRHIAEFLYSDVGTEKIKEAIEKPLGLKVAVHYGCHLIKPSRDRGLGSFERPRFFDELVEATGSTSVEYSDKMECCGAGGGMRSGLKERSLAMAEHKLSKIKEAGVDCIVNACPFCHMQLDAGQKEIEKAFGKTYEIPVLHYSQLLGLALGFPPEMLGIHMNVVQNMGFMEKLKMSIEDN
ncbi:MAG: CoB--CoM heterodisulfide reductase subunit B [Methanomethylovorans sp. PtaU1.Bin093]|uniref:CoB--CoM heterodisulfide reductase subunit B n=1 Tax=Methanomethylovorans sp. PtaU1.Bin093 TaxID=1811679 RepID=UPI0009D01BE4|nr:CoB--CoM heterodisulfide reductase subunit B [Methanomethylovorans sp. PtaU1.Bin093]OPY18676.1 MAG: CoB--CoM heterodisulfide reductase subunit B [Methanomethylovorans sp. PtaU1.Bin093]